ncbi:MAG: SDR family oxidoreductase [Flavobacteriales bacterium]|jgi:NAD(P)-dependent dehydrogenase (short-subunit alcohol dehydrogenase family)|nr:SDR family oxidoreductase [Flavobacteriales bacterium]
MSTSNNNWALILGGSSGIGLASVKKLANKGLSICVAYRERRAGAKAAEATFDQLRAGGANIISFNMDALSDAGRKKILDDLASELEKSGGKIRVMLHSIARGNLKLLAPNIDQSSIIKKSLEDLDVDTSSLELPEAMNDSRLLNQEDYQMTIYAMGSSLLDWANEVRERGLFADDARIIGLTSEGNKKAWKAYGAVSAAKAVLEAMARSMALELAPFGIRTNIIQAGVTDTPSLRMIPGSSEIIKHSVIRNPFHRLTQPEDVANVVYLLSTDEATWINGTIINVDGGEQIA